MKRLIVATLAAALVFCAASAQAASINPTLDDRFQVRLGPFFASIDSKVKVSSGQEVDLEERFDDSETTGAIYLGWRVTPRISLEFGYSQVTREASETLSQSVPLGDVAVLPAGSTVSGEFNTRLYRLNAGYSVFRNERSELGLSLGVAALNLEDRIDFSLGGGPAVVLLDDDTTDPLGTIGIFGTYAFNAQWLVTGRVGYLGFDFGDIGGKIWDAFGAVEYRPWKNVGFGLAYVYTDADIEVQESNVDVDFTYSGPFAYVTLGFGTVAK